MTTFLWYIQTPLSGTLFCGISFLSCNISCSTYLKDPLKFMLLCRFPGAVLMKGLSRILGLSWLYKEVMPKTWLRPFVNTALVENFTDPLIHNSSRFNSIYFTIILSCLNPLVIVFYSENKTLNLP